MPETGAPQLRNAQLALYAQSAVALLCVVLLLGAGSVETVFAVAASVATLGHVLLAVRLPAKPTGVRRVALWVSWPMIPMFIAFSVPAPPKAVADTARRVLGRLAGAAMAMLVLAIVIPLVLLALITGLVMSLGTKWRLVRYWWVLVKFAIALSIPLFAAVQEASGCERR